MKKDSYRVVGVMSGTSLDGLDIVYATFDFNTSWSYEIHIAETIPYDILWKDKLKGLAQKELNEIRLIDDAFTEFLIEKISNFFNKHYITNLDAICSHGHTALHKPNQGITYQIGNQVSLAEKLGITVVCNFRGQDVMLGGQGAPLVPIGDQMLFSKYDYCLNLGGFSNVSTMVKGERIAYDICPVNVVLNHYVGKLGHNFDNKGAIAQSGFIDENLLASLNKLDYYLKPFPKSLGIEWVYEEIFSMIDNYHLSIDTILRTFVEHIAIQISKEINVGSNVLVTGGGAHNFFLIKRIEHHLNGNLVIPEERLINFKEALIFGLLGVLKLRGEINCLSSVTGALKDHSSGDVFHP